MSKDTELFELLRLLGKKTDQEKGGKKELIGIIPDEILEEFLDSADEERKEFEFLERSFHKERERLIERYEHEIEHEMVALSERYQDMANKLTEEMREEHKERWQLIYDYFRLEDIDNRKFGVDRDLKLLYEVKNK